jgi:hypothetical protein
LIFALDVKSVVVGCPVLAVFFGMAKFGFDVVSGLAFAFLLLAAYALVMYWVMKVEQSLVARYNARNPIDCVPAFGSPQHSKMNIEILYMRLAMAMEAAHDGMFGRLANQFSVMRRFRSATITFICFAVLVGCVAACWCEVARGPSVVFCSQLDIWGTLGLRRIPWAVYSMGEILQFTLVAYLL